MRPHGRGSGCRTRHHLQIAVAHRLTGRPAFRNLALPPAYVEGWGLYAERLGEEMGVYGTDLARLGSRTKDALRRSRLVVDAGLHALAAAADDSLARDEDSCDDPRHGGASIAVPPVAVASEWAGPGDGRVIGEAPWTCC